tara:strand:+ start:597 stop:2363 length:1767 start_codon:yes stop_codon:yes gene_type:complete
MKYPKEYLDEIKIRLKVSTVISRSVSLKKRGKEFVGLSPFKNEKTPSFTVNDEKGFYHCFSTGEHGNIFDFVMKTQNFKFGEAVKFLANLAGMSPYIFSKADEEREKRWKEYASIFSRYIDLCHDELLNKSTKAKDYLKKRNIGLIEVKKFKIGFVNENNNFYEIIKKDFKENIINETGLFYFDEKKKKFVERFRNRIIFPINNISGQSIGIGGRIIVKTDYLAKYINSPETPFFKKGNNLYNLDSARKLSNITENIFLVEGYMDVIGLSKNGIENVVANLGTALTEKQILLLNQFFNHIIICFDGDESGYKAAIRAAENSIKELKPDKKISFLFLNEGEDPDSFVNKKGKDFFIKYSNENLIPIHEFIFNHYKNIIDNTPTSLANLEKNLRLISKTIKDDFIKKYILEFFLEKISEFTPHSNKKKNLNYSKNSRTLEKTRRYFNETNSLTSIELKEFSLLYLLFENKSLFTQNSKLIENIKLYTKENSLIFKEIFNIMKTKDTFSLDELKIDKQLIDRVYKYAPIKNILKKTDDDEKILSILDELIRDFKNYELEVRIEELESKFSQDLSENTFNQIRELKKQQKVN